MYRTGCVTENVSSFYHFPYADAANLSRYRRFAALHNRLRHDARSETGLVDRVNEPHDALHLECKRKGILQNLRRPVKYPRPEGAWQILT